MSQGNASAIESIRKAKNLLKALVLQLYGDPGLKEQMDASRLKESLVDIFGAIAHFSADSGIEIDEMLSIIEEQRSKKEQVQRLSEYSKELAQFLSSGFQVTHGSPENMLKQLTQLVSHAESLWDEAACLYQQKRFSTACFLSIVCIEECSKISFGEFQFYHRVLHPTTPAGKRPRGKNPLNSHLKKHFLAACSGALVNSRMDKVLGLDQVNSFIQDCESGKLEKLRQRCLYADTSQIGAVLVPEAQISKEQSLFYVCLAGELLAQIEGAESIRGGLQDRLDKFEAANL